MLHPWTMFYRDCDMKLCPSIGLGHRRLCRVKNMFAMYLKYHKAGLTPTTPVTSTSISPVKMSIGCKSLTNLRSEMIFLQGKPVFSSPGPKVQVNYCHHLASVVCRL